MFRKIISSKLVWFFGTLFILYGAFHFWTNRTVSWQEEVPLNTGETIWVTRSMPWNLLGGFGNPFDIAMRPTREQTLQFKYGGKEYAYIGRANVLWITISSKREPVLVAPAADFGWYSQNTYYCVVPYYVQLVPAADGVNWSWPEKIEPWLYEKPANLMASIPTLDERRQERYTTKNRDQRDATYRLQFPAGARIDPFYKAGSCITKSEVDMNNRPDWTKK